LRDRLQNEGGRPAIGVIYNPRQGQVKNGLKNGGTVVSAALARTSLVCEGWNRYLAEVESATYLASKPAMRAVLDIIIIVLDLYVWLLIASAILSWLIAFNVVNTRNQFVAAVAEFLYRITEPLLAPIRSFMPNLGGLDISPIILILIIMFIQRVIAYYIYPSVF
jgi:YggT family protein